MNDEKNLEDKVREAAKAEKGRFAKEALDKLFDEVK